MYLTVLDSIPEMRHRAHSRTNEPKPKKMKVVFISLFKRGLGGGEGMVAHELAQQFAAGHDVVLICPAEETGTYTDDGGRKVFGIQSAGNGEFQMPALSGSTVSSMFYFLDAFGPDVIHSHEPAAMGLIAQTWAKMNLVPFVHTTHMLPTKPFAFGATDALDIKLLQSSFSESVTQRVLTNFYDNCDAIIALNRFVQEALRRFGYEGRIFVIPNGRDLQKFEGCMNADTALPQKVVTFTGYLSKRKNQRYLIEMLKHLPTEYKLQLIGKPLDPQYGRQLRDICEGDDLDNVVFTGQVEFERIPSYLEGTHVFVSASTMEVQSLAVIEALASGTPVVGLSNETIDELVDGRVGYRLPKDTKPEEFARHVRQICTLSQSAYDELCTNARDRVSELDWSNIMALTIDAYNTLLKQRAPATEEESSRLADLVSFLPSGEVKETLKDKLNRWDSATQGKAGFRLGKALRVKVRALRRVPQSTWLLAGLTMLVSLIGQWLIKYIPSLSRSKRSND